MKMFNGEIYLAYFALTKGCPKCDHGWISTPVTKLGWKRMGLFGDKEMWITAGGAAYQQAAGDHEPIAKRMCDCQRASRGLPPMKEAAA